MTKDGYLWHIAELGLTQVAAGRLFLREPRTSRRWAAGHTAVPPEAAILLRLLVAGKISKKAVRWAAKIEEAHRD